MSNREQPDRNYKELLAVARSNPTKRIVYERMRTGPARDAIRDIVVRAYGASLQKFGCRGKWDAIVLPTANGRAVIQLNVEIQEAVGVENVDQESDGGEQSKGEACAGD